MRTYCLAIIFDQIGRRLLLQQKTHPPWQADLYNCPGGRLKDGEDPRDGTSREVLEELGVTVPPEAWLPVAMLSDPDAETELLAYKLFDDEVYKTAQQQEDELLIRVACSETGSLGSFYDGLLVSHLAWLLALALEPASIDVAATFKSRS